MTHEAYLAYNAVAVYGGVVSQQRLLKHRLHTGGPPPAMALYRRHPVVAAVRPQERHDGLRNRFLKSPSKSIQNFRILVFQNAEGEQLTF